MYWKQFDSYQHHSSCHNMETLSSQTLTGREVQLWQAKHPKCFQNTCRRPNQIWYPRSVTNPYEAINSMFEHCSIDNAAIWSLVSPFLRPAQGDFTRWVPCCRTGGCVFWSPHAGHEAGGFWAQSNSWGDIVQVWGWHDSHFLREARLDGWRPACHGPAQCLRLLQHPLAKDSTSCGMGSPCPQRMCSECSDSLLS